MRRIVLGLAAVALVFSSTSVAMAGGYHHGRYAGRPYCGPANYARWGAPYRAAYPVYRPYPVYGGYGYPAPAPVGLGLATPNFSFWVQP